MSTQRLTHAALTLNTKTFAAYGRLVGHPLVALMVACAGLALLSGLSAGAGDVKFSNSLSDIWIEEGSRSDTENSFVDDKFGGAGRIQQVGFSLSSGVDEPANFVDPGILTGENLRAMIEITKPLLDDEDADFIKATVTVDDQELEFSVVDVCDRPDVPVALAPYTHVGPYQNVASWALLSGTTSKVSGMAQFMSACLGDLAGDIYMAKNSTTISDDEFIQLQIWFQTFGNDLLADLDEDDTTKQAVVNARAGLPLGFGFNRFPCPQVSPLECFNDGGFSGGEDLKVWDEYMLSVVGLSASQLNALTPNLFSTCRSTIIAILQLSPMPLIQATGLTDQLVTNLLATSGLGYWWRPTIAEAEASLLGVSGHVFAGISSSLVQDSTSCVSSGVARMLFKLRFTGGGPVVAPSIVMPTCCTSFSPSVFVSPELFVGGPNPDYADIETWSPASSNRFAFAMRLLSTGYSPASPFLKDRLDSERGLEDLTESQIEDIILAVEQEWKDYLEKFQDKDGTEFESGGDLDHMELNFMLERTIPDTLSDAANLETSLLVIGYVVLIAYSVINYVVWAPPSKGSFIYSRAVLCFGGIVLVGFSISASFGFCAWIDLELSPINAMLVPFLGVGLGVDDVFVMLNEYLRHSHVQEDVDRRMTLTLADAGSSVTVTSAANTVAFLMPAAFVRLPAVYLFSYQMGAAIILNWITLMFVFVPLIVLDATRVKYRKSWIGFNTEDEESRHTDPGKFSMTNFVDRVLCPLYVKNWFKFSSIALFLGGTIALTVHGFENIEIGLKLSDVALKGSYLKSWLEIQEGYFPTLSGSTVTREIDYTFNNTDIKIENFQSHIFQYLLDLENSDYVSKASTPTGNSWLTSFRSFARTALNDNSLEVVPEGSFYALLNAWLSSTGITSLSSLICEVDGEITNCFGADGVTKKIIATKSSVYFIGLDTDPDFRKAIPDIRDAGDSSEGSQFQCCGINSEPNFDLHEADQNIEPAPIFVTGSLFRFWGQYVDIDQYALRAIGFSLIGVFVATMLFQFSPVSSLLVGIMLLATVLQLFGFMPILGVKLNGFSVTNLAVAIGMSVEFTAHISYAYLRSNAKSDDPNERMVLALKEMFLPMFVGAVTTIISVVCIAFAKYPFFSLYYFQMIALMQGLAFVNGMWFLPIILSWVAPVGLNKEDRIHSVGKSQDNLVDAGL